MQLRELSAVQGEVFVAEEFGGSERIR